MEGSAPVPESVPITVYAPEVLGTNFTNKHHAYPVQLDGSSRVSRRFNDFVVLRDLLQKQFPGVFVACLPPKKLLKLDSDLANERQADLQTWINKMHKMPIIGESKELYEFLTNQELDKYLKAHSRTEEEYEKDLWERYKETYPRLSEVTRLDSHEEEELSKLQVSFHDLANELKELALLSADLTQNAEDVVGHLQRFNVALGDLYGSENAKEYKTQLTPLRVDCMNDFARVQQESKQLPLAYRKHLATLFKQESDDVQSMSEVLDGWAALQAAKTKADTAAERWTDPAAATSRRMSVGSMMSGLRKVIPHALSIRSFMHKIPRHTHGLHTHSAT